MPAHHEDYHMYKTLLLSSALLIGGSAIAAAQQTKTPQNQTPTTSQTECWDQATNQVRKQGSGSVSGSPQGTVGTGANPKAGTPGAAPQSPASRPAGMPNC
jgi:hypothetical protein